MVNGIGGYDVLNLFLPPFPPTFYYLASDLLKYRNEYN